MKGWRASPPSLRQVAHTLLTSQPAMGMAFLAAFCLVSGVVNAFSPGSAGPVGPIIFFGLFVGMSALLYAWTWLWFYLDRD